MSDQINSKILGSLTRESAIHNLWNSDPHPIPFFNGKRVLVSFDYDPKNDKTFISDADSALANFLDKTTVDREDISDIVYKLCVDFIELIDLRETIELFESLKEPEDWHRRTIELQGPLLQITSPQEVWGFVHPEIIRIVRTSRDDSSTIYIMVLCNCDWDEEHGVQLVFKNGLDVCRVSEQDGDPV